MVWIKKRGVNKFPVICYSTEYIFVRGALIYKSDMGAPTDTSNWRAICKKRGSSGDRSKKGGSMSVELFRIQAIFFFFSSKFDDFARKFWLKKQKIGVIGCKVVKRGAHSVTNHCRKSGLLTGP